MNATKEALSGATLLAVEGDLGEGVPCFLFQKTIHASMAVEGRPRSIRIKPPIDEVKIIAFDGTWGKVAVVERNGPQAVLRMHRSHFNVLGLPTDIVEEPDVVGEPNGAPGLMQAEVVETRVAEPPRAKGEQGAEARARNMDYEGWMVLIVAGALAIRLVADRRESIKRRRERRAARRAAQVPRTRTSKSTTAEPRRKEDDAGPVATSNHGSPR